MKMMTFCILTLLVALREFVCYICTNVQKHITTHRIIKVSPAIIPMDDVERNSNYVPSLDFEGTLNFGHLLKMTFIKIVKIYFTPITKVSLKMVHCVKLLDTYHLFVYGDVICYNQWQIAILAVILPGILLFPICFELAVQLLNKRIITSTHFVAAIACPYYALLLHLKNRYKKQEVNNVTRAPEEEEFAKRVLEGEYELFEEDRNFLGWQMVQLYRTIIINIITTFIPVPYYRLLALAPVLIAFFIHDRYQQPYKSVFLNNLQSLSSLSLLVILLCNVTSSVSII